LRNAAAIIVETPYVKSRDGTQVSFDLGISEPREIGRYRSDIGDGQVRARGYSKDEKSLACEYRAGNRQKSQQWQKWQQLQKSAISPSSNPTETSLT